MNLYIGNYSPLSIVNQTREGSLKMPIEWMILKNDGIKALLLAKNILNWECYGFEKDLTRLWQDAYVKEYLEKVYLQWFSKEERGVIEESKYGKLFLLSAEEISEFIPNSEDRRAVMMFLDSRETGLTEILIEHSSYWLRATDIIEESQEISIVTELGDFDIETIEQDEIGVRPAMWVDSKKARQLSAKKGFNSWHHCWRLDEF